MSKFYIVRHTEGEPVEVPGHEFEDGASASTFAKGLSKETGIKHSVRPRKEADPNAWKAREQSRFKTGMYKPLPVSWSIVSAKNPDHFLHVDTKNPEMVAYFASPEDGQRDRATVTTPGRYIGQFTDLNVTGEQAKHLIAEIDAARTGVLFAWSRADFKRVYENGPSSCMHKRGVDFPYGGIHPAEMYAAGDLALAHFWDEKTKKASARAVCWPEKKLYGRCYGDIARLQKALSDLGYKPVENGGTSHGTFPAGVRFHLLENPQRKGHYVAPYLDNFNCSLVGEGEFAVTLAYNTPPRDYPKGKKILTRGAYGEWVASRLCPKLQNMQPEHGLEGGRWYMIRGVDEEWSEQAKNNHAFTCAHTKELWPKEDKYRMIIGGQSYARSAAEAIGSFRCAVTGLDYLKSDLHAEEDGQFISKAGHTHRQRLERLKADRERERKRLADERKRWEQEMELVEETVTVSKKSEKALNHHVVLNGVVSAGAFNGTVYVGNAVIGAQHEDDGAVEVRAA